MAERTISVKLDANAAPYIAAMAKARAATSGLATSGSRDFTRLGGQMQRFGSAATLGVSVPLLALGAGAVSMAAKFETAFAQMEGLANVPREEIEGLKESVLALAGETAVAPQELAEGLYFAASAGLDAAAAMDAVALAAKASAAGMGSTKDVVGLVASAVAAYGEANITAAEATDILTSTIREGRAEPAELASTLGRVLPIAASLGVSFDDVGASVALLTNVFGDTNRAVTGFQGLLVKLQSPSLQGKKALDDFGLSVEAIRQAIAEDGLLGAFRLLTESGITGSAEAMAHLFDDIEGRQAVLALLNTDTETLNATFAALDNSAGSLDTAFNAVADTSAFKMKQAIVDIQVAMTEVGAVLLPIVADIASSISGLTGWFTDLNPAVQKVVLAFGGLMVAAGPLTLVAGTLLKNFTQIAGAFGVSESAATRTGRALGALGLVVGAGVLVWKILGQGHLNASAHIDTASDALANATRAAYDEAAATGEATTAADALAIAHTALSNAIALAADDDLTAAFARMNVTADKFLDTLMGFGPSGSAEGLDSIAMSARLAEQAFGLAAGEGEFFIDLLRTGRYTSEELAASIGVTTGEMETFQDALFTVTQYGMENRDEINAMALAYLNSQGSMQGASHEALIAAEAIAGSRFEAGNAVPVYEEFIRQLTLLDPAAAAAALAIEGTGAAAEGAGGALGTTAEAAAAMRDVFASIGRDDPAEQLSALLDVAQFGRYALVEIAEAAGVATVSAERLVGAMVSLSGPDFLAWVADAHPDLLEFATGLLAINDAANATSGKLHLVINPAKEMRGELVSGAKAIGGAADEVELAAGTIAHAADEIDEMAGITSDATRQFDDLSAAASRLSDAINQVVSPSDDLRASAREVYATYQDLVTGFEETAKAAHDAGESYDVNSDALDVNTEAGRTNQENLEAARDAILEHGVAMVRNGASAEEAAGDIAYNTKTLHDNLIAAGFSEKAVADLIAQYNLTPEQVATILSLEGEAHANEVIARYNSAIDSIPDSTRTYIQAAIDRGALDRAEAALNYAARYREAIINVRQTGHLGSSSSGVQLRAEGGYIGRPEFAYIGEAGPEVILPLGNPARMATLLGMSEVGPRVAAALGKLMPVGASAGGTMATATPSAGTYTVIVNNNGRDITVDDIARAINQARAA